MLNLEEVLQNIGFTEKESKVYLACLESGLAGVSDISKRSKINRVTTYDILERLLKKGVVSLSNVNDTKLFEAIEPETVVHEFERKTQKFRDALPDFKRIKGGTIAPKIRYFEGIEGIKAIYEDTLSSSTEILNYANSTEIRKHWENYDEEYVQRRIAKRIYLRGLTPDDEQGLSVVARNHISYREIRPIDKYKYNFPNEVNIYDNKVATISFNEHTLCGIIIDDKDIANTERAIFQMAWDLAQRNNRN